MNVIRDTFSYTEILNSIHDGIVVTLSPFQFESLAGWMDDQGYDFDEYRFRSMMQDIDGINIRVIEMWQA